MNVFELAYFIFNITSELARFFPSPDANKQSYVWREHKDKLVEVHTGQHLP